MASAGLVWAEAGSATAANEHAITRAQRTTVGAELMIGMPMIAFMTPPNRVRRHTRSCAGEPLTVKMQSLYSPSAQ
jgi:hypothetical protein